MTLHLKLIQAIIKNLIVSCILVFMNQCVYAGFAKLPQSYNYNVLSLSPHLTDILQELDLTPYIKGMSDDAPEFKQQNIYQQVPIVADAKSIFTEQILNIQQNLIKLATKEKSPTPTPKLLALMWRNGNPQSFEKVLGKYQIPIIQFQTKSVTDIFYTAYFLVYLLHPPHLQEKYLQKIRDLQTQLIFLKKINRAKDKKYFFQPIWSKPWMILNGENYSNDFLSHCALENAFKNAPTMQISIEAILRTPFNYVIYNKESSTFNEILALKRLLMMDVKNSHPKWLALNEKDATALIRPNLTALSSVSRICSAIAL